MKATLAALSSALVLAPSALAAAPNYIFVSGAGMARPVLLADWSENGTLLSSLVNAPFAKPAIVRGLAQRPRLEISEFWGWGDKSVPTSPRGANQRGWFYPANAGSQAFWAVMVNGTRAPRLAPVKTLRILERHGIPVRR